MAFRLLKSELYEASFAKARTRSDGSLPSDNPCRRARFFCSGFDIAIP